jgi:hypothetical protein
MIPIQLTKTVKLVPPQLKDNGAFAGAAYVDTKGWGHIRFMFIPGTIDAAIGSTADTAAPKIEECDTTNGTYSDVTGAALADAIAATEDAGLFAIDINLADKTHKRYMQPNALTAGDGTTGCNFCAIAILSKPDGIGPSSAAEQGLTELIIA